MPQFFPWRNSIVATEDSQLSTGIFTASPEIYHIFHAIIQSQFTCISFVAQVIATHLTCVIGAWRKGVQSAMFCRENALPPLFSLGERRSPWQKPSVGERRPPWQESFLGERHSSRVMSFLSFLNSPKPYNTVQWTSWKPTNVLRDAWEASNHWSARLEQRWW